MGVVECAVADVCGEHEEEDVDGRGGVDPSGQQERGAERDEPEV